MTTEKIITAIAQTIYHTFGDEYEIHTEDIEQDLKEPCFLVLTISDSLEHVIGSRYQKNHAFDIHYFPGERSRTEINNVSDVLYGILEYIETDEGILRGTDMNAKTEDYVLHFFVGYDLFVKKHTVSEETMTDIQENIIKKG